MTPDKLKTKIEKLENPRGSGEHCPHLPAIIGETNEDGTPVELSLGARYAQKQTVPDDRVCLCGRDRLRIDIVYVENWRPQEGSGHETE